MAKAVSRCISACFSSENYISSYLSIDLTPSKKYNNHLIKKKVTNEKTHKKTMTALLKFSIPKNTANKKKTLPHFSGPLESKLAQLEIRLLVMMGLKLVGQTRVGYALCFGAKHRRVQIFALPLWSLW